MPTIDLPDDEFDAVRAAIQRVIEDDRFPHAPRLDPLRAALARLEAASAPSPPPKAPPGDKGEKRSRRWTPRSNSSVKGGGTRSRLSGCSAGWRPCRGQARPVQIVIGPPPNQKSNVRHCSTDGA